MTKRSSAEEIQAQGEIQAKTEVAMRVAGENRSMEDHLAFHAMFEAMVPLEELEGRTLHAPCGCRMMRGEDNSSTVFDSSRCVNRQPWIAKRVPYGKVDPCPDCRLELTAVVGFPVRFTPCPKHRAEGWRPNWCWSWQKRTLPQDYAHEGKTRKGYWPKHLVTEGERAVVGHVVSEGGSGFNVLVDPARAVVPLSFVVRGEKTEEAVNNLERKLHNAEVAAKGICRRAGCLHNEPEGFHAGE